MNKRTYTKVSFRLSEIDFQYIGGLDNTGLLGTILGLKFPIEILKAVRRKYRGRDCHYYDIIVAIHRADMAYMEATIEYYPECYRRYSLYESIVDTKGKYSQMVSDMIWSYSELLDTAHRGL